MADETVDNILFKPDNPRTGNLMIQAPQRDARDAGTNINKLTYILTQKDMQARAAAIVLALGGGIYGL